MSPAGMIPRLILVVAAGGLLSGCLQQAISEFEDTPVSELFFGKPFNMTEQNFAAADYMVGQVQTFISKRNDFIKVVELVDIDEPSLHSPIGKAVPLEIGTRFSQLGYQVDLSDVATGSEADFLKSSPAYKNTRADFLIAGNYRRLSKNVDLKLRVVEAATGRVISTYDYTLPYNGEIRKDSTPEARIIRMDSHTNN